MDKKFVFKIGITVISGLTTVLILYALFQLLFNHTNGSVSISYVSKAIGTTRYTGDITQKGSIPETVITITLKVTNTTSSDTPLSPNMFSLTPTGNNSTPIESDSVRIDPYNSNNATLANTISNIGLTWNIFKSTSGPYTLTISGVSNLQNNKLIIPN